MTIKWGYKCHDVLCHIFSPIRSTCDFFIDFSWHYAHYQNGRGPRFPKNYGFRKIVSSSWRFRNDG